MVEIKPILLQIQPWDALKGTNVYFSFTGSKQSLKNNLVIKDVSTGAIVYSFDFSSFEKVHPIPPSQLSNGKVYSAKLRVGFDDGTYSPYSNEIEFRTIQTPVLDIDNIDGLGHVYNKDVTFVATYSQSNGESVRTYRFSLYDENEDLIENYPIRICRDNIITEVVSELVKGKGYFIECEIETVNGFIWSHRERFIPLYLVPSVNGVIMTQNDEDEGFVRITANLKHITGTQVKSTKSQFEQEDGNDSNNYDYIDNDWIVIPSTKPVIFQGLGMNRASDYVMKVWCKSIPSNTKFLELSPEADSGIAIQFWKYNDRIVAVKEYQGIVSRYCSNIVTVPSNSEFMLYVKNIEHRIDLSIAIL